MIPAIAIMANTTITKDGRFMDNEIKFIQTTFSTIIKLERENIPLVGGLIISELFFLFLLHLQW